MTPEVGAVLVGLARGEGFSQAGTQQTRRRIRGRDWVFCTAIEHDPIQRKMRSGAFYETSDLCKLDAHFPAGGTFVDMRAARAGGYRMERRERNPGAAAMVAGEGDLEVWRGDDLLAGAGRRMSSRSTSRGQRWRPCTGCRG